MNTQPQTFEERLQNRIDQIKTCRTPDELSFAIWPKDMDNKIGSQNSYRDGLINWIHCFKTNTKANWKYKSPREVVEAIWQPYLDEENDIWFPSLRNTLEDWILDFKDSKSNHNSKIPDDLLNSITSETVTKLGLRKLNQFEKNVNIENSKKS